jgi:CheY-like chemotaxis protein
MAAVDSVYCGITPSNQLMARLARREEAIASELVPPAILVVDDNAAKRMAVRAMLAPLGCQVSEVDSGREALRAVLRRTFAMILMDVRMPTLDGYETAKLIRQRAQSELTPIIFVTAFGGDEAETATAYASGAVEFIFTPILPDVLRAKSRRSLTCSSKPKSCNALLNQSPR